jgi:hypothetical protein
MQVELLDSQRWNTQIELANAIFEYLRSGWHKVRRSGAPHLFYSGSAALFSVSANGRPLQLGGVGSDPKITAPAGQAAANPDR